MPRTYWTSHSASSFAPTATSSVAVHVAWLTTSANHSNRCQQRPAVAPSTSVHAISQPSLQHYCRCGGQGSSPSPLPRGLQSPPYLAGRFSTASSFTTSCDFHTLHFRRSSCHHVRPPPTGLDLRTPPYRSHHLHVSHDPRPRQRGGLRLLRH